MYVPLKTKIALPKSLRQRFTPFRTNTKLKTDLSNSDILSIVRDSEWPQLPFIAVAKKLRQTEDIKLCDDFTAKLCRYVNKNLIKLPHFY